MSLVSAIPVQARAAETHVRPPVLRAFGLKKSYGGQKVLDGISLDLDCGEIAVLRGDNGSGKTTLLNILTGNLEPDTGEIELRANGVIERFAFPRRWWQDLNPFDHFTPERMAAEGVGRTWQDIRLFQTLDLQNNIAAAAPDQLGENPFWALFRHPTVRRQEQTNLKEARATLAELGLGGSESFYVDKISLGYSRRAALARGLHAGAKILFLDEPMAGLDAEGVSQVLRVLRKLAREQRIAIVMVEHVSNICALLGIATKVWTLDGGRLAVEHPQAVRQSLDATSPEGIMTWLSDLAGSSASIRRRRLPHGAAIYSAVPAGCSPGDVVLELSDVSVRRGKHLIPSRDCDANSGGVSFTMHEKEVAVLQAPNGWGKTSLLHSIAGCLPLAHGTISFRGRNMHALSTCRRAQAGISYLQCRDHVFGSLTVSEAMRLAGALEMPAGLLHLQHRRASELSGGEKQQLAVATALAPKPLAIAVLDEPFSALDGRATQAQCARLSSLAAGRSAILITAPGLAPEETKA